MGSSRRRPLRARVCVAISMLEASSQAGLPRSGPLLSAVSVSKRYGDFLANDRIDLDLFPAEIHALLGENGAGKSTLVKMMYGLIQPSAGEMRWRGRRSRWRAVGGAHARHRHGVPAFLAVREPDRRREHRARPRRRPNRFGTSRRGSRRSSQPTACRSIPGAGLAAVGRRAPAHRDRPRLLQNPKLIILDEPTSVLTPQEADKLFACWSGSERGPRHPLHHPPAGRGEADLRPRHRAARTARRSRPAIRARRRRRRSPA